MAQKALPSPEVLRQLLRYEPDTGKLFWLPRQPEHMVSVDPALQEVSAIAWNNLRAGTEAFTASDNAGYKCGTVQCRSLRAHRTGWAIYHGTWPINSIDHIDGCRSNNALLNLRDVTHKENCRNAKLPTHNTSGSIGVFVDARTGKWAARIQVDGLSKHLGLFPSYSAAVSARQNASERYGFGPSHGARQAP